MIGFGVMGRNHARVLASLPGVNLIGVVDPNLDAVDSPLPVFPTVDSLLTSGVDYCVVSTPTVSHEAIGLQLAQAGVCALIEKPLSYDFESAQRLASGFKTVGLVAAVGHIERYNSALIAARNRIDGGDLGHLYHGYTRREGPFSVRITDVGVVKDLATHDIDTIQWLTNSRYRSLSAKCAYRTGRDHEDLVNIVGEMTDGLLVSHIVNWLSPYKLRKTTLVGERGAIVVDTLRQQLTIHRNGSAGGPQDDPVSSHLVTEGEVEVVKLRTVEPLLREHQAFRDALIGKEANIVSLTDGAENVRVAEAIIASARQGRTVTLEDPGECG